MIVSSSRRSLSAAIRKAKLAPLTARPGTVASLFELAEVYLQLLLRGCDHRHVGSVEWESIAAMGIKHEISPLIS